MSSIILFLIELLSVHLCAACVVTCILQGTGSDNDFENNGQKGLVADVEIWKSGSVSGRRKQ